MGEASSVAVIPARGNSKRVPGKNLAPVNGRPMISWVIETATSFGGFDRVVVSTEDSDVASVARRAGAEVPFLRPDDLSGDEVGLQSVVCHTIKALNLDGKCVVGLLFATAVGLIPDDLQAAFEVLSKRVDREFVVAVARSPHPVERALRLDPLGRISLLDPSWELARTQDLAPAWFDGGQFALGSADAWQASPRVLSRAIGFEIPSWRCVDVDEPDDLIRASLVAETLTRMGHFGPFVRDDNVEGNEW